MSKNKCFLNLAAGLAALCAFAQASNAAQVILSWNASPENDVVSYYVSYGLASGARTFRHEAGAATTVTVPGLTDGTPYFFVVRAVNIAGLESPVSNEVMYSYTFPTNSVEIRFGATVAAPRTIKFQAQPAKVYELQATENFGGAWSPVFNPPAPAIPGFLEFTDTFVPPSGRRFYRLVTQ